MDARKLVLDEPLLAERVGDELALLLAVEVEEGLGGPVADYLVVR